MTLLINKTVLMSDAENFSVGCPINPYYQDSAVDCKAVVIEHNNIRQLLESSGVKITTVKSPKGCQDGVYTANWALIRGDLAVLARLPNARQQEEEYAEQVLTSLGKKIIHLPKGVKFSGQGDALPCGDLLFCGSGYRSDPEAQEFVAGVLGYDRVQLQTIPLLDKSSKPVINKSSGWYDSYFYDIDLALAVIKPLTDQHKGLIAYCPAAFTTESQKKLTDLKSVDKIEVSLEEAKCAFATNLVSTGETVVMSADAPKLRKELESHGLKVVSPKITELAKGGGYIRCVTLTID